MSKPLNDSSYGCCCFMFLKLLRTVDNFIYDTFNQAAFHRHLLNSDEEWDHCLHDASAYQMPKQLRQTFAFILRFCNPSSIGLPVPTGNAIEVQPYNQDDEREEAEQRISSLNREQLAVFETITRAIGNNNENDRYFLDGPGGSGKTFLYSTLLSFIRGNDAQKRRSSLYRHSCARFDE
ncbi:hypothetical protein AVEN_210285-1 [Araneus ventricosus]|uniref:ATP-dependent DNA helicase n=1 Tax=Araneus ventricosus TaxID=182803 RepID=A0A4Y2QI29_ARAVE|nr:hypothetical protein AVEN_210285-1 [Araneus ventricosus]